MTEDGIKVYHWTYDDGSKGYAVRYKTPKEKEWLDFDACSTKTKFRQEYRKLKVKNKCTPIKRKKCGIPGGLSCPEKNQRCFVYRVWPLR